MPLDGLEPLGPRLHSSVPVLRDTKVWSFGLDLDSTTVEHLARLLAPDELARASQYRRPLDRNRFIAGRAQLRQILGKCLGEKASSLRFEYSPHGKPSLAAAGDTINVNFNASGSDGLGLVALRQGAEIGVDVERRRKMPDVEQLAARLFGADEHADYLMLSPTERELRFFDAWVRKEAVAKSLGAGLHEGLDRLQLHPWQSAGANRLDLPRDGTVVNQWVAPLALTEAGFAAAVASSQPFGTLDVRRWSPMP